MKTAHPTIGVDLRELRQRDQLRALEIDELDVCFVYLPVDERAFFTRTLFEGGITVAVPTGNPLAQSKKISMRALALETQVIFSRDSHPTLTSIANELARSASPGGGSEILVSDKTTALDLVERGLGATFLPENAARPHRGVAYVPLECSDRLQFAVVWSRRATESIVRQRLLDAVEQIANSSGLAETAQPRRRSRTQRKRAATFDRATAAQL